MLIESDFDTLIYLIFLFQIYIYFTGFQRFDAYLFNHKYIFHCLINMLIYIELIEFEGSDESFK